MHLDCSGIGDGNRIGRIARIEEARVPVARVLLQDAGTGRGRLAAGMSCTVKAGSVWIGLDRARTVGRSTAERAAVGPSPGSIFPGCFVHALRVDFRIAPGLRGDYGLCWTFLLCSGTCCWF